MRPIRLFILPALLNTPNSGHIPAFILSDSRFALRHMITLHINANVRAVPTSVVPVLVQAPHPNVLQGAPYEREVFAVFFAKIERMMAFVVTAMQDRAHSLSIPNSAYDSRPVWLANVGARSSVAPLTSNASGCPTAAAMQEHWQQNAAHSNAPHDL